MTELDKNINDLEILIPELQIQKKVRELAEKIDNEVPQDETIYLICVLKGAVMFFTELSSHLKHNIQMEFIKVSSYGNETKSSQKLKVLDLNLPDLTDKSVVIVEDIIDTGLTAKFLTDLFKSKYKPKKFLFVSLLNKKSSRQVQIEPDLFGFEVDDKFVVGYGLDYKGFFRNLHHVGYFTK